MKTLTLQLDDQVASDLEHMAGVLGLPVEAVAINALREMKKARMSPTVAERLQALDRLQRSVALTPEKSAAWLRTIEAQRF